MATRRQVFQLAGAAIAMTARRGNSQVRETPFPPHRIAENLYYVGSQDNASYLITSRAGHALINSSFAETVPLIRESIEGLGFKLRDVKLLLNSHAHNDHVAGNARMRAITGARVLIMTGDEEIVRTGGKGDFHYQSSWEPCPVDHVLKDREEVKLGDQVLTAHRTAGHTRGCTTWTVTVREAGKPLRAVIIGSPNVNTGYRLVGNKAYPAIAEDYQATFRRLKSLPCDLFLGAHGAYYDLEQKYPKLGKGPNPFIDPAGYTAYVLDREAAFQKEWEKQKRDAAA